MPSRLRYLAITPAGQILNGRDVKVILGSMLKTSPIDAGDWATLERVGQKRTYWTNLFVWRERRGLKNAASDFHQNARRNGSHTPEVRRQRANARVRRTPSRIFSRTPVRIGGSLLGEEPSGERRVRPGIFA